MILVVGGSSAGHSIPAQEMGKALSEAGYDVVFYDGKERVDWKNVDAVLAAGSRKSVPMAVQAKLHRKKLIIHEQNVIPGRANRFMSSMADIIFLAFEESRLFFNSGDWQKLVYVGMPVREATITAEELKATLKMKSPLIVVTGGSQGSAFLNFLTAQVLLPLREKFFIVHQSGPLEDERYMQNYIRARTFPDLQNYIAAADLVIGRAGSSTLHECLHFGTPAIFFPMAHSPDKHQWANAEVFKQKYGYPFFWEHVVKPSELLDTAESLMNNGRRLPVDVFNKEVFVDSVRRILQ
jgi:UDP-N-acetylglucosamine--N-acetylmuramyl-(pentapeptide) pyrophosphoryl-undecaprenol N-acetylglucosamine transferase